jgi:hypothetical protein
LGDILSAAAIHGGLSHFTVTRLTVVKKVVTSYQKERKRSKKTDVILRLNNLLNPLSNNKAYREYWKSVTPSNPCVPFLANHLRDVTFQEDGNADKLASGQVNVKKITKLSSIITDILKCQNAKLPSECAGNSDRDVGLFFAENSVTDNALHAISHRLQPFLVAFDEEENDESTAKSSSSSSSSSSSTESSALIVRDFFR